MKPLNRSEDSGCWYTHELPHWGGTDRQTHAPQTWNLSSPLSVFVLRWFKWYFSFHLYFWVYFGGVPPDFWDTLTLPRAGWTSRPPSAVYRKSLKGQWRHKRSIKPPISPPSSSVSPISAQTCLVLFCLVFLNLQFILYSVFLLQVNICFSVLQCVKVDLQLHVCLADQKSQLMTTAASAVSIRNLDSIFALF